ncbi:MAG TPA: hypothetical protein VNZ52_15660 [Candidatus Thermoplasmatota archaeon]|nr:hypothetical protein [Candidatus Thermoplasmatota archaeon]
MPPKSIAQRRIEIYLPSVGTREEWVAAAEKRGVSLSEFVFDVVHTALTGQGGDLRLATSELRKQVDALTGQVADQQRRIEELEAQKARLENDIEGYRAELFLTRTPGGGDPVVKVDRRLLQVFIDAKDRDGAPRPVTEEELRKRFRLTPKDIAGNKALNIQVGILETFGLIKRTKWGWALDG